MALTVTDYVNMYWPNLSTYLNGLNEDLLTELVDDSVNIISKYNTRHLTSVEITMVKALIVCSKVTIMASVPGFKEDKFLNQFRTGSVTRTKDGKTLDIFTEEIKQYIPNYNEIAEVDRTWIPLETYRKSSVYLAPKLDTRERRVHGLPLSEIIEDEWEGER